MKKRVLIGIVIILIALTNFTDLALSLSRDPQWTPFVLTWKEKLPKAKEAEKAQDITICSSKPVKSRITLQR